MQLQSGPQRFVAQWPRRQALTLATRVGRSQAACRSGCVPHPASQERATGRGRDRSCRPPVRRTARHRVVGAGRGRAVPRCARSRPHPGGRTQGLSAHLPSWKSARIDETAMRGALAIHDTARDRRTDPDGCRWSDGVARRRATRSTGTLRMVLDSPKEYRNSRPGMDRRRHRPRRASYAEQAAGRSGTPGR